MFNEWPENGVVQETDVQKANRKARERDERDRAVILERVTKKMLQNGLNPNPNRTPSNRNALYFA